MKFVAGLVDTRPEAEGTTLENMPGDYKDSNMDQHRSGNISIVPNVSSETNRGHVLSSTPSPPSRKRVTTFQIRERLRAIRRDEEDSRVNRNVTTIRKEIQRAYRTFAGSTSRTEMVYKMELVLRLLLTTPRAVQSQQSVIRRTLRSNLELIRDLNLRMLSFKATGGLTGLIERELRDIADSIKIGSLYSVEVLLHPYGTGATVRLDDSRCQIDSRQLKCCDNEKHRPTDHMTSSPGLDPRISTTPGSPVLPLEFFSMGEDPKSTPSNRPVQVVFPELEDAGPLQIEALPNIGADITGTQERNEDFFKVPIEGTMPSLMLRHKERQVKDGPDVFLSLLDLVRNK